MGGNTSIVRLGPSRNSTALEVGLLAWDWASDQARDKQEQKTLRREADRAR